MTNKGHFKEEIFEIACEGDTVAVDKETNKPRKCSETSCVLCALFNKTDLKCVNALAGWLEEEHKEPDPFEEGELVEVSDDRESWYLEYFVKFTEGMYETREYKEDEMTSKWIYCQKYGTLGGLVKG